MITYRAGRTLDHTLSIVSPLADEIIILDTGSDDETEAIAEKYQAIFKQSPFLDFSTQKQKAINLATSTWVLLLDDDEYLDEDMVEAIKRLKESDSPYDGYFLPRSLYFMDTLFRYGKEAKSPKLILFRNGRASMDGSQVHESLIVDGPVTKMPGLMWHDSFADYADAIQKMDRYAQIWAESHQKNVSKFYIWLRKYPGFLKNYLFDLNFLNGKAGYCWSKVITYYQYKKYQYLYDSNIKGCT